MQYKYIKLFFCNKSQLRVTVSINMSAFATLQQLQMWLSQSEPWTGTILLIIHEYFHQPPRMWCIFSPSVCLMKPSWKPLDVQTKQKPSYRQKLATTSVAHWTAYSHFTESLASGERKNRSHGLHSYLLDAECTFIWDMRSRKF